MTVTKVNTCQTKSLTGRAVDLEQPSFLNMRRGNLPDSRSMIIIVDCHSNKVCECTGERVIAADSPT
jgi:hypothetical protein